MTVKRVDATQVSGLTWLMVLFFVPRGFSPGTLSTDITTSIFSLLLLLLSHRFALFIYYYFLIFCAQYISNLPSICHHSICTNNNLQQTTTITQNTLLSSQHACDKIKAYGYMEFHTTRGQNGFCSMKQEHLHCNSVQYYIVPPRGSTVDLKDQLYL